MGNYLDLKGKHVFISGGASGIGEGLVIGFLQQRCRVSFLDIDRNAMRKLHYKVDKLFSKMNMDFFLNYDWGDLREVNYIKSAVKKLKRLAGPVDILINNAADDHRHSLKSTRPQEWDALMEINLRPYFFLAKEIAPDMKKEGGSIINLSSNCFLLGLSGYPVYVTAKAGIMGMTKALARELGPDKIRVNCLIPGWVMTEKQKEKWVTQKALKECIDQQCLKKTVEVSDVVQAALFLASESSRMITGQSLVVDGGRV